ncbi:MAG TPA: ABC transporter substrate-binding protein [Candidatus Limnocylindrales bacterium]
MFVRARILLVVAALLVAGCIDNFGTPAPSGCADGAPCASVGPSTPASQTSLTVGLGYIPSVQFAPFYLALSKGYYAAAGLNVTFQNKADPDLVTLVGQGSVDIGVADGTSVIPAVSQGIPIKYVATIYGTFPNVVFSKPSAGIITAADLKGKKIGTPGKYGSSWIMLQALLGSANLTTADVQVTEYPQYTQGAALQQGVVDAATGFTNNEPVQLQLAGVATTSLHIDQILALPGPGLIAGTKILSSNRAAVQAFVSATLRAMNEIAADPQVGLDASASFVPEIATARDAQLAVLQATIATWKIPNATGPQFGAIDTAGWTASIAYMTKLELVPNPVTTDQLVDPSLLP